MKIKESALVLILYILTMSFCTGETVGVTVTPRGSDAWEAINTLGEAGPRILVLGRRWKVVKVPRPTSYPDGFHSTLISEGEWLVTRDDPWNLLVPPELRHQPVDGRKLIEGVAQFNLFKIDWQQNGKVAVFYRGAADTKITALQKGLASSKPEERIQAVLEATWVDDPRIVQSLMQAAGDSHPEVSRLAVKGIYRLGFDTIREMAGPKLLPALERALADTDWNLRRNAVEVLGRIGGPEVSALIEKALKDKVEEVRGSALLALGKAGSARASDILEETFVGRSPVLRAKAVQSAGYLADPKAAALIAKGLKDKDPKVRLSAVRALGLRNNVRVLPVLEKAILDKDKKVRFEAVSILGGIGGDKAAAILEKTLNDEAKWVRRNTLAALGKVGGSKAAALLAKALKDSDEEIRAKAALAAGQLKAAQAIALLETPALKDEDYSVRASAVSALGKFSGEKTLGILEKALADEDEDVRIKAVTAIGEIGGQRAMRLIEKAFADAEMEVRIAALAHAGRVGGEKAVALLEKALKDKDEDVQWAAISPLGEIGNDKAMSLLEQVIQKEDGAACAKAAGALCRIGGDRVIGMLEKRLEKFVSMKRDAQGKQFRRKLALSLGSLAGDKALQLAVKTAVKGKSGYIQGVPRDASLAISRIHADGDKALECMAAVVDEFMNYRHPSKGGKPGRLHGFSYVTWPGIAEAALRLGGAGDTAFKVLKTCMIGDVTKEKTRRQQPNVTWRAVLALEQIGGDRAVEMLEAGLQHKMNVIRWSSANALAKIGGDKAREVLVKRLKAENDPKVKAEIGRLLKTNFTEQ